MLVATEKVKTGEWNKAYILGGDRGVFGPA
jgi:hypothetical protein